MKHSELKQLIREEYDKVFLTEKLITFGGKAYPKFNQVVILAGGAGSGKSFQQEKLLGIEGKLFNVDRLKELSLLAPKIYSQIKDLMGIKGGEVDKSNPEHIQMLHDIINKIFKFKDKERNIFYKSLLFSHKDRKPNIIFDLTLKNMKDLWTISMYSQKLGYDLSNIHMVWVINDVEVAKKQNLNIDRNRVMPEEILVNTHDGVASTMKQILDMGSTLSEKYLDGDIWFSFNKKGEDTEYEESGLGGAYIKDAFYVQIKKQGQSQKSSKDITKDVLDKILKYIPKDTKWES
jgi:hypothetical protein